MEKKAQLISACLNSGKILAVLFFLLIGTNAVNAQNYLPEGQALANLSSEAVQLASDLNATTPGSSEYAQLERKIYLYKYVAHKMVESGEDVQTASVSGLALFTPASSKQSGSGNNTISSGSSQNIIDGASPMNHVTVATVGQYDELEDSLMDLVSN